MVRAFARIMIAIVGVEQMSIIAACCKPVDHPQGCTISGADFVEPAHVRRVLAALFPWFDSYNLRKYNANIIGVCPR